MNDRVQQALLDVARRFARLRESSGSTTSQLAARAGLDAKVVEQIERGDPSTTLEQLRAAVGALGLRWSDLFDTSGKDTFQHVVIVGNVLRVLGNLAADTPCIVLSPGMAVPQPPALAWPDVVVVRELPDAGDPNWLIRKPLVSVEVMTEASELADRGDKFIGYRKLESLVDYVMVKTHEIGVEHYTRHERDAWRLTPSSAGARVQLQAMPGRFAVDDLYRDATFEK